MLNDLGKAQEEAQEVLEAELIEKGNRDAFSQGGVESGNVRRLKRAKLDILEGQLTDNPAVKWLIDQVGGKEWLEENVDLLPQWMEWGGPILAKMDGGKGLSLLTGGEGGRSIRGRIKRT